MAADVLVKLDMHKAVFLKRVHLACLGLARLQEPQRLRDRHLIDQDLILGERRLGYAVAGLDETGARRLFGRCHACRALEELADRDGIRGVIRPLVDHLEPVLGG